MDDKGSDDDDARAFVRRLSMRCVSVFSYGIQQHRSSTMSVAGDSTAERGWVDAGEKLETRTLDKWEDEKRGSDRDGTAVKDS